MTGPRVLFSCYPTAFQAAAGGEVQLLKTFEAVRRQGVCAEIFDPWKTRIADYEILHHFSFHPGAEEIVRFARSRGLGIAISTICWPDTEWWFPLDAVRSLADQADLLLPNSRLEARRLARVLGVPRQKFHVVRNGIDQAYAQPPDPRPFLERFGRELPEGRFALCVGRFDYRKNQLGLIRAMRGSSLPVVFIGGARDPAYLERCHSEAGPRVLFLDPLPAEDPLLRSAYAACGVFVMPGLLETPGLAALEAAASGAPLVVTQEGSTRAYFGRHATYVHPLAFGEMRSAVERAAEQPRSQDLRWHVLSRFTWDRAARETVEAYRKLLALALAGRLAPPAPQPRFMAEGFIPASAIALGGPQDFQLRLGWGRLESLGGRCARLVRSREAALYLKNEGQALRLEGWSAADVELRVRVDGALAGSTRIRAGDFSAAFSVSPSNRELREVQLEIRDYDPERPVFVSRVALE